MKCAVRLVVCCGLFALIAGGAPRLAQTQEVPGLWQKLQERVLQTPELRLTEVAIEEARGKELSAQGEFDLKISAHALASPVGFYDTARLGVKLDQPTTLWGARFFASYRVGRGNFPVYYLERETLEAGELSAGIELPLWRGRAIDERRAKVRLAQNKIALETQKRRVKELEIKRKASALYWKWVVAHRKFVLAESLLELATKREAQLEVLIKTGSVAPVSKIENQRAVLSRRNKVLSARQKLQTASLKLSLFWRDQEGEIRQPETRDLLELTTLTTAPIKTVDKAVEDALLRRPEVAYLRLVSQGLGVEKEQARNTMAPRVDMRVYVSRDFGETPQRILKSQGVTSIEGGLVFELPLQRSKARGKLAQVEAKRLGVQEQERLMRDKIRTEVRDLFQRLEVASSRVELAEQEVDIAAQLIEAEEKRFRLGASSLLLVNLREQSWVGAREKLAEARGEVHQIQALLQLATASSEVWSEP